MNQQKQSALPEPIPLFGELPEPKEFPLKHLGGVLKGAAEAIHEEVQAPMAMCAMSVLASASHAVQAHADVRFRNGQKPLSLWIAIIGESGERKSSVDRYAMRPQQEREEVLRKEYREKYQSFKNDEEAYRIAKDSALPNKRNSKMSAPDRRAEVNRILAELGPEPSPPRGPILRVQDATMEALNENLRSEQPSLAWMSSEGGAFLQGPSMQKDRSLHSVSNYCQLYDGDSLNINRKGSGNIHLEGKRMALCLMMQPFVAKHFLFGNELLDQQGLLSRMIVIWPRSTQGERGRCTINLEEEERYQRYCQRLTQLLAIPPRTCDEEGGQLRPRVLELSKGAKDMLEAYCLEVIEPSLRPKGRLRLISGFANKSYELAHRIAGVICLTENPDATEVTALEAGHGVALVQYFIEELLRLREGGWGDPALEGAQELLDWAHTKWMEEFREGPLISSGDIARFGPKRFRRVADAKKPLKILEEHNWLIPQRDGVEIRGKKCRKAWLIQTPNVAQ